MNRDSQSGFTLLEMLLAITLFALLSMAGSQILTGMIKSNQLIENKTRSMALLQQVITIMERDISQALIRPAATISQINFADFAVTAATSENSATLELVRSNWLNPGALLPRSSLERIRYQISGNKLLRISYSTPDTTSAAGNKMVLLDNVQHLSLRFWHNAAWQTTWHSRATLPEAIELTLTMQDFGPVQHIILLSGAN